MTTLIDSLKKLFTPHQPIPAGSYHYRSPADSERQIRFHLRIDSTGGGLMILNASTVLHLNQTAAEFAYHLTQGTPIDELAQQVARRYSISANQARQDFLEFQHKINTILDVPDLDPVTYFDLEREDPYTGAESAPYRLDCALTYRLPEGSSPELAPGRRVDRELDTGEWKTVLDKAWEAGIPHVIFTGGEPTLREDLLDLIAHAEEIGQVTGLLTGSLKLGDRNFLDALLLTGLDHLMFALTPQQKRSWEVLKAVLAEDLFTTVHLTIKPDLVEHLPRFINTLAEINTNALSLSVSYPDNKLLLKQLEQARTLAAESKLTLKWDLPVPYSRHNPVALEVGEDCPSGAGKAWMYVEPDGDVLPAQGVNQVLGNLLRDDWDTIWSSRPS